MTMQPDISSYKVVCDDMSYAESKSNSTHPNDTDVSSSTRPFTLLFANSVKEVIDEKLNSGIYYVMRGDRTVVKEDIITKAIVDNLLTNLPLGNLPFGFVLGSLSISGDAYQAYFDPKVNVTWSTSERDLLCDCGLNPIRNYWGLKNSLFLWGECFIDQDLNIRSMKDDEFDKDQVIASLHEYKKQLLKSRIKQHLYRYVDEEITEQLKQDIAKSVETITTEFYPDGLTEDFGNIVFDIYGINCHGKKVSAVL